jgi:RNA polymerase sigma factor (sigma-70 family)
MSTEPRRKNASGPTPGEISAADQSFDSTIHILERAQRGDRTAAQVLIERAVPVVRRWARGRLPGYARNDANTEDVVQDAVVQTLKGLRNFQHRTVGGLQAYLRTSVVNRIRDLIRRSKRRGISVELDEELPAETTSPLESAILQEGLARFLEALQRLKPADRQVVVWRLELGYSVDEIAQRLGKSTGAARMTVYRAMGRLATELNINPQR